MEGRVRWRHVGCGLKSVAVALVMAAVTAIFSGCDPGQFDRYVSGNQSGSAGGGEPLRYAFQKGRTYFYDIRIEADLPNAKDSLEGRSQYTVQSVDPGTGRMTLKHSANLSADRQVKPRSPVSFNHTWHTPFGEMVFNYGSSRQVTIEPTGRVVNYSGESQLPLLLGNAWALVLVPLAEGGEDHWEVRRDAEIRDQSTQLPVPRLFFEDGTRRQAEELGEYRVDGSDGNVVFIEKSYRLTTADQVRGQPILELSGRGRVDFDRARGVVKTVEMRLTVNACQDKGEVEIPITLSARLLDDEETQKILAEKEEARKKVEAVRIESEKPLDRAGIEGALADLRSKDGFRPRIAAARLARTQPVGERQSEVARALEACLKDGDASLRHAAVDALKVWATMDSVPALIAAADDSDTFLRTVAIWTLARFKDPRAAEVMARGLTNPSTVMEASQALRGMGPVAEEPVLAILAKLEVEDMEARWEVCKILGAVGTARSVEPLKSLLARSKPPVTMEAKRALAAIESRQGQFHTEAKPQAGPGSVASDRPGTARVFAYEPFDNSRPRSALLGEDGGQGFAGSWFATGYRANHHDCFKLESASLEFPGLPTRGGCVLVPAVTGLAGIGRRLAQPIDGGETTTRYFSFLVRPESTVSPGPTASFFGLYLDGSSGDLFVGTSSKSGNYYFLETRGGGGRVLSPTQATADQTALLVVKGEFAPGNDRFTLYVDPDPNGTEPASGTEKQDLDVGSVTAIVIYSNAAFQIDELRMGSDYAEAARGVGTTSLADNGARSQAIHRGTDDRDY